MFKEPSNLAGFPSLAEIRLHLINQLTLVALVCLLITLAALFFIGSELFILDAAALPIFALIAVPNLLPLRSRVMVLVIILIFIGVPVTYTRMAPMGGRVWVILGAALGTILLNSRTGFFVLIIGLFALYSPLWLYYQNFIVLSKTQIEPDILDWSVQIFSGIVPGFLMVYTVAYVFNRLDKSEAQRRAVTDQAADFIWSANPDFQITFATPAVIPMLGLKLTQVINHKLEDVLGKEFVNLLQASPVSQPNQHLLSTPLQIQLPRQDGSMVWTETAVRFVRNPDSSLLAITGITRDISHTMVMEERHQQLEAQLRQSQKMESIGQLAGGIAHDFNNLLGVILGYTDLIRHTKLEHKEVQECVDQISKAGNRAAALTEQLLLFSRQESVDMKLLDVNELVLNLETMLTRLVPKNILISCQLSPGKQQVLADQGQLEQVLVNLVVNAKDAISAAGTIQINTSIKQLDADYTELRSWSKPGTYSVITIRDTGEGISRQNQSRIFEPFFTTKAQGKGTGLGLAVVFGIIKQHGGFISLQSESGTGSEFQIYLPLNSGEVPPTLAPLPESEPIGGNECILVIEDNEALCNLAVKILISAGYRVTAEADGEAGLARFEAQSNEIDLVFSDVVMPKLGGLALAEKIRKIKPGTPVLFTSGYTGEELHIKHVIKNDVSFMEKPYSANTLLHKVRRLLNQSYNELA